MIHVETLPLGPLGTNCYLVYREGSDTNAWSSTPGAEGKALAEKPGSGGLQLTAIAPDPRPF